MRTGCRETVAVRKGFEYITQDIKCPKRMLTFQKFGLIFMLGLTFLTFALFFTGFTLDATVRSYFYRNYTKNLQNHSLQRRCFKETFLAFPWTDFEEVAAKNLSNEILLYSELLIAELTPFLMLEPLVPVNEECSPPPFPPPTEINCTHYPNAFNGMKRSQPLKIAALLQFGFDVDVLEIHLNELYGVVDKFFIIESTRAHYGNVKKPLMWEHVKQQDRFKKFPVVHFVVDDAESSTATDHEWSMEYLQERLRWEKFLQWNAATKYFNDEDIIAILSCSLGFRYHAYEISPHHSNYLTVATLFSLLMYLNSAAVKLCLGFGDTDEIPNRAKLNLFKYCNMFGDSVDFGIWFPFGHINQAFKSDFPVQSHPLTLGDPTFYKLAAAKRFAASKLNAYPNRRRGRSQSFMLGGIHMSHYGYLPFQIVKHVTATEGGLRKLNDLQKLSKYLKIGNIETMEVDLAATPKMHLLKTKRVDLSNPEMKEICLLPWFYDCNRDRYPVWEDGHDTRLD